MDAAAHYEDCCSLMFRCILQWIAGGWIAYATIRGTEIQIQGHYHHQLQSVSAITIIINITPITTVIIVTVFMCIDSSLMLAVWRLL